MLSLNCCNGESWTFEGILSANTSKHYSMCCKGPTQGVCRNLFWNNIKAEDGTEIKENSEFTNQSNAGGTFFQYSECVNEDLVVRNLQRMIV